MNKDHFFAGLSLVFVIVLTASIATFYNIHKSLTADLRKAAAERDQLDKDLKNMREIAAATKELLDGRLNEIEELHGHIRKIGECVDGILEDPEAETENAPQESLKYAKIKNRLDKINPDNPDFNAFVVSLDSCRHAYDIFEKLNSPRSKVPTAPSLDLKTLSSR